MKTRLQGWIAAITAALAITSSIQAQPVNSGFGGGSGGLLDSGGLPGLPGESNFLPLGGGGAPTALPLGNPGNHGFYTFGEAVYLNQTWTLGSQVVAWRGLVDAQGILTGLPGTYLGSGVPALTTTEFGRSKFSPGFNLGVGYKLEDGTSFYIRYQTTANDSYSRSASLVPPYFRSRSDLADTYLTAGVFNFTPQFAGPATKTALEGTTLPNGQVVPNNTFYGVWNGASVMSLSYVRRFTESEIGGRVPLFQTEYSRVYALAGGRFNWFFERFRWNTQSYDSTGATGPTMVANYTNTLSQRMYGPYLGFGHDVFLGNRLAVATEMSGAMMFSVNKERAKYELGTGDAGNKRSMNEFTLVPTVGGSINLLWYPISGVQMRIGYQANTFWNTRRMTAPVGFDYGAIDPGYGNQVFRLVHGLNLGLGFFF